MSLYRLPNRPPETPIVPASMNIVTELAEQDQKSPQHIQQILSIANAKVVADGPLARAVTEELMRTYKREIDPSTGVCLETQAIEATMGAKLWASTQEQARIDGTGQQYSTLFAVKHDDTRFLDVQNLRSDLRKMSPQQRQGSAVIIEGQEGTQRAFESNPYARHLRDVAFEFGVRVYPSLESYLKDRARKR